MIQIALLCGTLATALSQCPYSTSSPSTISLKNDCGTTSNEDNSTCKNVSTIDRPLSVIFKEQPLYAFILSKDPRFIRTDSVCYTFFPLPDGSEKFKAYLGWRFIDGSTLVESFITKSYGRGVNFWSYPTRSFVYYNLGNIGCGSYVRYSCPKSGNAAAPFIIGFGPGNGTVGNGSGKLTEECFLNAQTLARKNGLEFELDDYYLLPYNLPTNCVFQQICLPEDSPLKCQQGNTCKAYNYSNA